MEENANMTTEVDDSILFHTFFMFIMCILTVTLCTVLSYVRYFEVRVICAPAS